MAVEYRLTLAGDTTIAAVAARALPDAPERIEPYKHLLVADLGEVGLSLTINADRDGYLSGEDTTGLWEWGPTTYVNLTLQVTKDPDLVDTTTRRMLDIVAQVLTTGPEDAALMLNGDYLLLTRMDGVTTKHRRAMWWDHYGFANQVIPG